MNTYLIVLIVAIVFFLFLLIGIVSSLHSPSLTDRIGKEGEKRVEEELEGNAPKKRYVFHSLYIQDKNGKTSEIDHVVVQENGIFVIETKNRAGDIYGREKEREWLQVLSSKKVKNRFYNPVMQNKTHLYRLSEKLGKTAPLLNLVVFPSAEHIETDSSAVIPLSQLERRLEEDTGYHLSSKEMRKYVSLLQDIVNHPASNEKKHQKEIAEMQRKVRNRICPRCNSKLLLKREEDGYYYECSKPSCHFWKKKDD